MGYLCRRSKGWLERLFARGRDGGLAKIASLRGQAQGLSTLERTDRERG